MRHLRPPDQTADLDWQPAEMRSRQPQQPFPVGRRLLHPDPHRWPLQGRFQRASRNPELPPQPPALPTGWGRPVLAAAPSRAGVGGGGGGGGAGKVRGVMHPDNLPRDALRSPVGRRLGQPVGLRPLLHVGQQRPAQLGLHIGAT